MLKTLWVGAGGFFGASARYLLAGFVQRIAGDRFPAGTLTVNVLGCFAIGVLMALVEDRQLLTPEARLFLMVGVLGGFTTFSTFGYESLELARGRDFILMAANVGSNVVLGLAAVWIGRAAGQGFAESLAG